MGIHIESLPNLYKLIIFLLYLKQLIKSSFYDILLNMLYCDYNCGSEAKCQLKNGKWCCTKSQNKCQAIRKKNSTGLKKAYSEGIREKQDMPEAAKGWNKGKTIISDSRIKNNCNPRKIFATDGEILSEGSLRRIILAENLLEYKCQNCNIFEWDNKPLSLELDHIDGNRGNNLLSNLRFLCPNCHSQTSTYKGRNVKKREYKTDEEFTEAIKNSDNARQALLYLGLAPKGGNYKILYERMIKLNLKFDS
jgi:5-methylcytosine-specific restriction endonuclease McrA